jgi:hypothetical protein
MYYQSQMNTKKYDYDYEVAKWVDTLWEIITE